ncbi:unnamed protein product [Trichogramma brassicae]|uniref:Uncharacterized protein n=1 Tax=Trichogramma brassicae TaxID=86971 RepID=A0A6H5J4B3_9HYME|nr:unnamed protein product [Trichogramma brassicae]
MFNFMKKTTEKEEKEKRKREKREKKDVKKRDRSSMSAEELLRLDESRDSGVSEQMRRSLKIRSRRKEKEKLPSGITADYSASFFAQLDRDVLDDVHHQAANATANNSVSVLSGGSSTSTSGIGHSILHHPGPQSDSSEASLTSLSNNGKPNLPPLPPKPPKRGILKGPRLSVDPGSLSPTASHNGDNNHHHHHHHHHMPSSHHHQQQQPHHHLQQHPLPAPSENNLLQRNTQQNEVIAYQNLPLNKSSSMSASESRDELQMVYSEEEFSNQVLRRGISPNQYVVQQDTRLLHLTQRILAGHDQREPIGGLAHGHDQLELRYSALQPVAGRRVAGLLALALQQLVRGAGRGRAAAARDLAPGAAGAARAGHSTSATAALGLRLLAEARGGGRESVRPRDRRLLRDGHPDEARDIRRARRHRAELQRHGPAARRPAHRGQRRQRRRDGARGDHRSDQGLERQRYRKGQWHDDEPRARTMSREAKLILSLLVVVSLNASTVTSVLFFGRRSYENASYVQVICSDLPLEDKGRKHCEVISVRAKIPHNDCIFRLNMGSRALGPDSMEVVRFGHDKAILSWRVEESSGDQPAASSWRRLGVVHLTDSTDCELHKPALTYDDRRYVPVGVVVNKNSFTVLVLSEEPDSPCRMPDSDLDVPRCAMDFDERGQLIGEPRVWFYQTKRDDGMILEPLEYENPESGYLLVDTIARPFSVLVRVHIVKPNGMTLRIENYQLNPTTNPYDHVAYSTANGLIGVCVGNLLGQQYRVICSQFDRRGKQTIKQLHKVPRRNQYSLINLPEGDGMLLLSYSCRDPDNLCNLVDSITISVSRIETNGKVTPDFYRKNELYTCNKKYYRGEAQLFQLDSGHYCYTHVCIGYPKHQTDTDGPVIYTTCLPDENTALTPKIHPDDENDDSPKGKLYFDPHSYKNQTWVTVYCGDLIHRDNGQTLCEVSRYRDQRLERTCEVWLYQTRFDPKAIKMIALNENKIILWWESKRAWTMKILHFQNCALFDARIYEDCQCYPTNIIVYDYWVAVLTSNTLRGPCKNESQNTEKVKWCKHLFDGKCQIMSGSPLLWFVQEERDDDMTLEPLENGNPDSGHLLIETSKRMNANNSIQVFVRASIVEADGQLIKLGSYELWDAHWENPHDGIGYSTANGLIGICVRNESKSIVCEQFDPDGKQTLTMSVKRGSNFDVINLVEPGAMLLLHYALSHSSLLVAYVSTNGVFNTGPKLPTSIEFKCDGRFNQAAGQLFMREATSQYCFALFCYGDSAKNTTDGNYRPEVVSTCLIEKKSKIHSIGAFRGFYSEIVIKQFHLKVPCGRRARTLGLKRLIYGENSLALGDLTYSRWPNCPSCRGAAAATATKSNWPRPTYAAEPCVVRAAYASIRIGRATIEGTSFLDDSGEIRVRVRARASYTWR